MSSEFISVVNVHRLPFVASLSSYDKTSKVFSYLWFSYVAHEACLLSAIYTQSSSPILRYVGIATASPYRYSCSSSVSLWSCSPVSRNCIISTGPLFLLSCPNSWLQGPGRKAVWLDPSWHFLRTSPASGTFLVFGQDPES